MSYIIEWVVPDRIISVVFPQVLDTTVIQKFDDEFVAFLDQAPSSVYLFIDVSSIQILPRLTDILNLKLVRHRNLSQIASLGLADNPTTRFVVLMSVKALGLNLTDFATREEALDFLYKRAGVTS
jgi:hypothetical protein